MRLVYVSSLYQSVSNGTFDRPSANSLKTHVDPPSPVICHHQTVKLDTIITKKQNWDQVEQVLYQQRMHESAVYLGGAPPLVRPVCFST